MNEQLTIFDWLPEIQEEPEPGAIVTKTGAVIPHVMQDSYIGEKVCFDVSTQSKRAYRVGILEKLLPDHYYRLVGKEYVKTPCRRAVIFTGKKQRSLLSLYDSGGQLFEVLPWNAYPERMAAIYGNKKEVNT